MAAIDELLKELGSDSKNTLLLISELAELVSYYRRLLERFELDALTGLPGNNKFREFTNGLEKRAASIGVIFFDVNNLKYYNDSIGHHAGDLLLQKAAESFHFISGQNVNAFRTGGDEFVMIITDCAEKDIDDILAKWREKLVELNTADDGIHCAVAHGAAFGSGQYKIGDVMKLADERMYAEKHKMKTSRLAHGG